MTIKKKEISLISFFLIPLKWSDENRISKLKIVRFNFFEALKLEKISIPSNPTIHAAELTIRK